ncbi:putative metal-dependent membrane protease [Belliella baltica DSM 15883]|uniref:Putative metal-dependent membrane protease n=1 Tax=Belliella baltica (strain DSM 15883 / CIP 108006 / LMG 21964 / BA134) TaxID=866536 RepID=I3Z3Q9_BELBD|nr:CPBP family intramembrane glutamic endopeptidase [Belliella baltica]AFL83877.1 putative metal-dependent membrane protease [Belliella baltica DSM 15883]
MEIYKTRASIASKSNWLLSLIIILLVTFGVMAVLQGIALVLVPPLFGVPLDEFMAILSGQSTNPNARIALLFVQGLGAGLGFFFAALLIAKLIDKANLGWKQQLQRFRFTSLMIMIMVMLGGMLFNSLLIDWNSNVHFPEFLSGLEVKMRAMEDAAMDLTKYITDFDSFPEFLMGVLVIGVCAGLGEEFFFRGVLQPKLHAYTGNAHVGIWLTAFIFSAIHFQFYGFFPRMLLGAIFGYLYLYSGSLIYPIVAHILNNTVTVILVYLNKLGKVNFDIEEADEVSIPLALLGLLILLLGLRIFKEKNKTQITNGELD